MKKLLLLSAFSVTLFATAAQAQSAQNQVYGTAFSQDAAFSPLRLPEMMKDKEKLANVKLAGYVSKVCQKEGCWMVIRSEQGTTDDVMVRMKDHAFVVPKNTAGKNAVVHGTVIKKTQSVAEQKHYLEDEGASQEEIAKITTPKDVYEIQATGVYFVN